MGLCLVLWGEGHAPGRAGAPLGPGRHEGGGRAAGRRRVLCRKGAAPAGCGGQCLV
jgi:hypothetical protein